MKHKINKNLLLHKSLRNGFVWLNRYSDTKSTDNIGRWARIGYCNGLMICWINGFVKIDGEPHENKRTGICNYFIAHLLFPTSSNQGGDIGKFTDLENAKKYTIEMFTDFKNIINN